jgi:hypothetical protein
MSAKDDGNRGGGGRHCHQLPSAAKGTGAGHAGGQSREGYAPGAYKLSSRTWETQPLESLRPGDRLQPARRISQDSKGS